MDERPATLAVLHEQFCCPGEAHSIDRATHLGRLASFYPACRQCEHQHDTEGLSSVETRRWEEVSRRQSAALHFDSEQFAGTTAAGLDAGTVHRLSAALGVVVWREQPTRRRPPVVVVGTDGHWSTAELFASACAALQWTGCRTVEVGAVTSPALACLNAQRAADAALWIGNTSGESQAIALKFWGASGTPWSSPGKLDTLAEAWQAPTIDRPRRGTGGAERARAADVYLPGLAPLFHGLRPLRFVLDTTCQPLVRAWHELNQASACEMTSGGQGPTPEAASGGLLVARRTAAVAQRVLASGAHFGMWIDGDGETCQLVDERGRPASAESFLLALASYVCRRQPGARVLLRARPAASASDGWKGWEPRFRVPPRPAKQ